MKTRFRLALAIVCAISAFAAATPARAHAVVVSSTPAANASIAPGAAALEITFNTRVDRARSRLVLVSPDGAAITVALREDAPPTLLGGRAELLTPGRWKLRWQVLAADGHITRGEIAFDVSAAPR